MIDLMNCGFKMVLADLKAKRLVASIILIGIPFLSGCGRYGPPLPPEGLAPRTVESIQITPIEKSLKFEWDSPASNIKGTELKSIEEYRIYRKVIEKQSDITDPDVRFDLVGTVEDLHIQHREKLREAARAIGKPGRRVDVSKEEKHFSFTDSDLAPGNVYLYQIIPVNQGGVKGDFDRMFLITWNGPQSSIRSISNDQSDISLDTVQPL